MDVLLWFSSFYFHLETVAIIILVYVLSEVCVCMCARVRFYYGLSGSWGRLMYSNIWCLVQMGSPVLNRASVGNPPVDALGLGHAQFLRGKSGGGVSHNPLACADSLFFHWFVLVLTLELFTSCQLRLHMDLGL